MDACNSLFPNNLVFDVSKIEFTDEVFDEKEIITIKDSFDKGFESTLKFVNKNNKIIIVDQYTKKL